MRFTIDCIDYFLDHAIIFILDNIEKIKTNLLNFFNTFENVTENGAFAP